MSNKFVSFLSTVGKDVKIVLDDILPIAQAATPFVTVANPAIGALMSTTIGVVVSIEQKYASEAGKSGPQKLADVSAIIAPVFLSTFKQLGVEVDNTNVQTFINAIVAVLNVLPALPAKA